MSLLDNMVKRLGVEAQVANPPPPAIAEEAAPLAPTQASPPTPTTNPEGSHGDDYLITKVTSMDRRPETNRGGAGYTHGSSLIGICPRRNALTILSGDAGKRPTRPQDRIMWAIGRAVEKHIRDAFVRAVKREGVIGQWACRCGKSKRVGLYSPTYKCEHCSQGLYTYGEVTLLDHQYRIAGNPDLLYYRPDNLRLRIVEIKSKKQALFDELTKPEANHILQASIYRRLAKIEGYDVDDYVSIVYGSKDYTFRGRPYKEYHILPSEGVEATLDDMWSRAGAVREFLDAFKIEGVSATLPNRITACASVTSTTAKGCDQCHACFAR